VQTEVKDPESFLALRYGRQASGSEQLKSIDRWNVQIWEDYCSYLVAKNGKSMLKSYWSKSR
jgi:hypothetical protein